jgi:hypothetical protein
MGSIIKMSALFAVLAAASLVSVGCADAKGRTGSHREGGYTSHGKGSHYYGGHTAALEPGAYLVAQTRCRDGSYSSSSGSGTCSYHGGEAH